MGTKSKVFISYSHDNEEHKKWVVDLAKDLRNHGVDAIIDEFDLRIGQDIAFFMEQGLSSSNLVICVCSENYVRKSNNGNGGVGYEKNILIAPLLKNANLDYIIPIIFNNESEKLTPYFLGTKYYLDFRNGKYFDNYRKLLERIYGEDKNKPKLGSNPFVQNPVKEIVIKNNIENIKYKNTNLSGVVTFNYKNNSGKFQIGIGDKLFLTSWSQRGKNSIYAYNDNVKEIGYSENVNSIPEKSDVFSKFDYSSRCRDVKEGEVVAWINKNNYLAATKILSIKNKDFGDDKFEVIFEFKIYDVID